MEIKQYQLNDEQKQSLSESVWVRFILKGDNHLATHAIWGGDRIDCYYLPNEKVVLITVQVGDYYHVTKLRKPNVENGKRTEPYEPEDVFTDEAAHQFMLMGIHKWDDIRSMEERYEVKGDRILGKNLPHFTK